MSKKSIFLWALAAGIAATNGFSGLLTLFIFAVVFWVADKAFDATAAFCRGWKSGAAERKAKEPEIRRAKLRVVNGGRS